MGASSASIGIGDLKKALGRLSTKLRNEIVLDAVTQAAQPVSRRVKSLAPAASGRLRGAVKVVVGKKKQGGAYCRIVIGKQMFTGNEYYGAFQEFGTDRMNAKHFMRRAFEQTKAGAKTRVIAVIRDRLGIS